MNYHRLLLRRLEEGRPLRIALLGLSKFTTMYLAQARVSPGVHVVAVGESDPEAARRAMLALGWPSEQIIAQTPEAALRQGSTCVTEDIELILRTGAIELVIESGSDAVAAVAYALQAFRARKHVIMVSTAADALVGPWLARKAREAGVVYSAAYGEAPALACELIDWARTSGFEVVAAGRSARHLPGWEFGSPDTVEERCDPPLDPERSNAAERQRVNAFLDGTKPALEMAGVANTCALMPAAGGLSFPPCGTPDLPRVLRLREDGGVLERIGQVEVVASIARNGEPVARDLGRGVFVIFRAQTEAGALRMRDWFRDYEISCDETRRYGAVYRPSQLRGLELGMAVASVGLRHEPTGSPHTWNADVASFAKRDLQTGETLEGAGGRCVYGRLLPAQDALALGALPIGLAAGARMMRDLPSGACVRWSDVELPAVSDALRLRREMENAYAPD
ncbi:MAG: hypothetical protein KF778_06260 [Rhodocyclaceae bacterium]|nr:hypothetical protein [Rhodocyclaceae bacterium]